ncbi:LysR family transcriptional regulator [Enterococcus sp. LJL128]|uniref:LysR family transcriptional regulator n=1 Tax=Enterococcus sp. LJL51 TaxID=3416656 RepID=UPI003CF16FA2
MDITQLSYFIKIVESGFNLSLAARKIHITQSALSQMITNFEAEEEVLLFERRNGRFEQLTPSGKLLYEYALEIISKYEEMKTMIRKESLKQKGTIRIGMPSAILRMYFLSFLPQFILEHPELQIEIVEGGAKDLKKKLLNNDLDLAILVDPARLDHKSFEEQVIQIDEYVAYMKKNHPLDTKKQLDWKDLEPFSIGTFHESYTTYDLVKDRLNEHIENAKIQFTGQSLEYLLDLTGHSDTVIILQHAMCLYADEKTTSKKQFKEPLQFVLLLCRPVKSFYTYEENFLYESILEFFYQPAD